MIQAGNIRVLGAGITAHATALLLSQQGWRVQLSAAPQRQHDASVRDIRAYAINHRSRATLSACGVWPRMTRPLGSRPSVKCGFSVTPPVNYF